MKKLVSISVSVLVAIFIITLSISLPILIRPFYYAQIDALELPKRTGLTYEEIKLAFDEAMDYCLGLRSEFSAGPLRFSEEGASHFTDVRILFIINFSLVISSAAALIAIAIMTKKKRLSPHRFLGRSPQFWSVAAILSLCVTLGICCAVNFRETFVFLHKIFFVGKKNYAFDPTTDPIIRILPNQFFSNCAILIFISILVLSVTVLIFEFLPRKKKVSLC